LRPHRLASLIAPLIASLVLLLVPVACVLAHEHRQVGPYEMVVGWVEEPAYAGFRNGVQVLLNDHTGKPFLDLGDTLRVEVIYGREKTEAVPLAPAFSAKFGRPGEYRAPLIPTRPGPYTFHFMGTIKAQKVDESFTASEGTFDLVREPSEIEFPAKDPTRAELALRIQRMGPRLDKIRDSLDGVKTLAAVGLAVGLAGLVAALALGRTRRPQ
jgi:hypothetical protein